MWKIEVLASSPSGYFSDLFRVAKVRWFAPGAYQGRLTPAEPALELSENPNNMNKPHELSIAEWKEITQLPEIREAWGLADDDTPEDFADMAYAVKFNYSSGMMPGYVGDLYIVSGDALGEPFSIIRNNGKLSLI
jgi:hypothetical protein